MTDIDKYLDSELSNIKSGSTPINSQKGMDDPSLNSSEEVRQYNAEDSGCGGATDRNPDQEEYLRDRRRGDSRQRQRDRPRERDSRERKRDRRHDEHEDSVYDRRRNRDKDRDRHAHGRERERRINDNSHYDRRGKLVDINESKNAPVKDEPHERRSSLDRKDRERKRSRRERERSSSRDRRYTKREDSREKSIRSKPPGENRERARSKSRSRSRRDSRSRRQSSSSSRAKSGSAERSDSRGPARMTPEEREAAIRQAAIDELTRDQRTVFVNQITAKVREKDLKKFFEKCASAPVKNVIMLRDKITNRHRGFAYVEMQHLDSVPVVLQYNNTVPDFQKFPIMVKASEAEKNYLAKEEKAAAASAGAALAAAASHKLAAQLAAQPPIVRITNIHPMVADEDLKTMVNQCGAVSSIRVEVDEYNGSTKVAEVVFEKRSSVDDCLRKLDGVDVAGKMLRVIRIPDPEAAAAAAALAAASIVSGGQHASGNWRLDDDTGSAGVSMNNNSRVALMAKLAQGKGVGVPMPKQPSEIYNPAVLAAQAQAMALAQKHNGDPVVPLVSHSIPPIGGIPSFCLLLKNMYNAEEETEDGWQLDIKEDAETECRKYGQVLHTYVDAMQPGGRVFVMFKDARSAISAANGLQGRWFAKRMLTVDYVPPNQYIQHFPEVASVASTCSM